MRVIPRLAAVFHWLHWQSSAISRRAKLDQAADIKPDELEPAIEGYPERRKNYALTAVQALQKAIRDYRGQTVQPANR